MRNFILVPALALTIAGSVMPAFASDNDGGAAKAGWMTIQQVTDKLTAEGYKVRQVKTEGNGYEVYAIDATGKRLEAKVDPMTGQVLGAEEGEDD